MGTQKLLLPWGDTTVLGQLLRQWHSNVSQIGVVCSKTAIELQTEFARASASLTCPTSLIFNPAPERGMFSSIQCAARWPGWQAGLTHWIITLGDQPQLQSETLRMLLDFAAAHRGNICQPMRNGRHKHPVLLPKHAFLELANSPAENLKLFLASHETDLCGFESADAGLDHDLDTPEDYDRLKPAGS